MDLVHEKFYSPKKGIWPEYDKSFVKESYTKYGELGWDSKNDTDHRNNARSRINEVNFHFFSPFYSFYVFFFFFFLSFL